MAQALRAGLRNGGIRRGGLRPGLGNGSLFAIAPLDMFFARTRTLDSRVTFTRASSGTYVGSDGVLKTATTNLLLRSEEFDNASWATKALCTISQDSTLAPNGTTTADAIVEDTTTGFRAVGQNFTAIGSTQYTISFYVKAATRGFARVYAGSSASWSVFPSAVFNLSTGTVDSGTGFIISVGSGWYRCSVTGTFGGTGGSTQVFVGPVASSGASNSYLGTGATAIHIWGAQLEQSSTVGEYIPTTSTINSAPRFDHNPTTGESLGLLVEEQRTNLLLNSGTLSTQNVTVTAVAHTLSFTGTGTITLTGTSTAGPLVGTGTGESNRVSLTFTPTAGSLTLTVSGTVTNAQLEAGAFRTSYIPTTTATATRNADVASITGANFSSWYQENTGTFFAAANSLNIDTNQRGVLGLDQNAFARGYAVSSVSATGNRLRTVRRDPVNSITVGNDALTTLSGRAAAYFNSAETAVSVNGATVNSNTTALTLSPMTDLRIGWQNIVGTTTNNYLCGCISRLCYWGQRLPNSTLQTLTQ